MLNPKHTAALSCSFFLLLEEAPTLDGRRLRRLPRRLRQAGRERVGAATAAVTTTATAAPILLLPSKVCPPTTATVVSCLVARVSRGRQAQLPDGGLLLPHHGRQGSVSRQGVRQLAA